MTTTTVSARDLLSVDLPELNVDGVHIEKFKITEEESRFARLRAITHGGRGMIEPGTYTKLSIDGVLWMSDSPDEKSDHLAPVYQALHHGGRVLINGLGIGMVVGAMLRIPEVEHVDVVELDPRVVKHIGPLYAGDRCTIHQGDALAMKWPTGTHWTVAWHDIWPTLCGDNLTEMARLHRMYGRRADWQGSWGREELEYEKRRESRYW